MAEGINQKTVSLRNVVSIVIKDINTEIKSLTKVLADITPEERRRRLLFWTVRSRQHIENLKNMCKWIIKYQPTIDTVNLVYKRINTQRSYIDNISKIYENKIQQGWEKWSRVPDISTAMFVLSHGTYPFLPNKIFELNTSSSTMNNELNNENENHSSEYEQLKYERIIQRRLISEKVPNGALLTCTLGGLVELLSPSFFVAFLILKNNPKQRGQIQGEGDNDDGCIWEVRGVEVLVNNALDLHRVGLPSDRDCDKLVMCANDVASLSSNHQTTSIERIYYCLSNLISTITLRVLESQTTSLLKSRQFGIFQHDMNSQEHILRIRFWVSPSASSALVSAFSSRLTPSTSSSRSTITTTTGLPLVEICGVSVGNQSTDKSLSIKAHLIFGIDNCAKHELKLDTTALDISNVLLQAYQICAVARLRAISEVFQGASDVLVRTLCVRPSTLQIRYTHAHNKIETSDEDDDNDNDSPHLSTSRIEFSVLGQVCFIISLDLRSGLVYSFLAPSLQVSSLSSSSSTASHFSNSIQIIQSKLNNTLQHLCPIHELNTIHSTMTITQSTSSSTSEKKIKQETIESLLLDMVRIGTLQHISSHLTSTYPTQIFDPPYYNLQDQDTSTQIFKLFQIRLPSHVHTALNLSHDSNDKDGDGTDYYHILLQPNSENAIEDNKVNNGNPINANGADYIYLFEVRFGVGAIPSYSLVAFKYQALLQTNKFKSSLSSRSVPPCANQKESPITDLERFVLSSPMEDSFESFFHSNPNNNNDDGDDDDKKIKRQKTTSSTDRCHEVTSFIQLRNLMEQQATSAYLQVKQALPQLIINHFNKKQKENSNFNPNDPNDAYFQNHKYIENVAILPTNMNSLPSCEEIIKETNNNNNNLMQGVTFNVLIKINFKKSVQNMFLSSPSLSSFLKNTSTRYIIHLLCGGSLELKWKLEQDQQIACLQVLYVEIPLQHCIRINFNIICYQLSCFLDIIASCKQEGQSEEFEVFMEKLMEKVKTLLIF